MFAWVVCLALIVAGPSWAADTVIKDGDTIRLGDTSFGSMASMRLSPIKSALLKVVLSGRVESRRVIDSLSSSASARSAARTGGLTPLTVLGV